MTLPKIKITKKRILLVLVLLGVAGFMVMKSRKPVVKLEYISPEQKNLRKVLSVSGKTNALTQANLRFIAGGKVVYLGAKEGDQVKRWQTIASVDRQELQKNLDLSLNTYSSSRLDFEQTKDNYKDVHGDTKTDRNLTKNELALRNQVLTVELRDIALKNSSLYSPINGVLVSSPTNTANVILGATDVFTIVDPNSLYFEVKVDEANISLLKPGQTAEITLDAYGKEKIQSVVDHISFQSSEADSGTVFYVRLRMPAVNDLLKYKLGMNGTADILLQEKQVKVSVPITSVTERGGKSYVDVFTSEKTPPVAKEVTLGLETNEEVEVLSGLQPTEKVVKK